MSAMATQAARIAAHVVERRDLQGNTALLVLAAPDGQALPPAAPGAHVDVFLPGGLVRQYSLCAPAQEGRAYTLGVLREPASRGGSAWLWDNALPGTNLEVGLPRNLFPLQLEGPRGRHVLLAGGIGITPLAAMARALHDAGHAFELHYSCRSRKVAAFAETLIGAPFAANVHLHFDDEPACSLDLARVLQVRDPHDHVYVCGPAGFMAAAESAAAGAGWPAGHVHKEFFAPAAPVQTDSAAFEVELRQSGQVLLVPPDRSIANVLLDHGVPVLLSCEQGICGTCSTLVVDGEPDHRDSYLTADERARNDTILICCSRAKSKRIVLDL